MIPNFARFPCSSSPPAPARKRSLKASGWGAQDYLRKPCEAAELLARVATALQISRQRSELLRQTQRLDDLSTTDPLTGLGNRRSFDMAVADLHASARPDQLLAVAMVDIDRFKSINDRHGHLIGDTVLTLVARRLRAAARDEDTLVRWGGEEFVVVRGGPDYASLGASLERMRASIADAPLAVGSTNGCPSRSAAAGRPDVRPTSNLWSSRPTTPSMRRRSRGGIECFPFRMPAAAPNQPQTVVDASTVRLVLWLSSQSLTFRWRNP